MSLPGFASAQEEHDDPIAERPEAEAARESFEAGMTAFDAGDYERAVEAFQATYALAPHPDVQFNIYSAAERGGQLELAAEALEIYLLRGEPGDRREVLVGRLVRLRERIAAQEETEEEPAAPPTAPEPEPVVEPEVTPAAPVSRRPDGVHPAGPILLVSAGVLLASFGAFAGLAAAEDSSLAGSCGRDAGGTCMADQVAGLEGLNLAADIAWISAAALGVTGLIVLFVVPPEDGMSLSVLPWATPTAAGVRVGGVL
ncbi:MAG: hypothetical protein AB8I08_17810 [Sandaracinaceae bacterium]